MKIILVDPDLVRYNFFDPNYDAHPWKHLFFDAR